MDYQVPPRIWLESKNPALDWASKELLVVRQLAGTPYGIIFRN
jgi:hypothetical protein